MIPVEKPGSPAAVLEHFGKKGMKWGVRNRYMARISSTGARDRRVGKGGGSKLDRLQSNLTTNPVRMLQAKGNVNKAAAIKGKSKEDHIRRMKTGKATTMDLLRATASVRVTDLVRRS